MDWPAPNVVTASIALFVVSRIWKWYEGKKNLSWIPGITCALDPLGFPGGALPNSWWNPSVTVGWVRRFTLYTNSDTISIVPFLVGHAQLYTANLDVARQILSGGVNTKWIKPRRVTEGLLRILGPAFNNKMYAMVWAKTLTTYHEWMATEEWVGNSVATDRVQKDIFKLALLIISACGFGLHSSWSEPPGLNSDETQTGVSVQDALRITSETITIASVVPRWLWNLPLKEMTRMRAGHEGLERFMKSQIAERKSELQGYTPGAKTSRDDVVSLMIRANEAAEAEAAGEGTDKRTTLDDQELVSNVFILLFAGHETTAHTLSATMALLSANPDIQQETYEQIIDVIGPNREPTFNEMEKLDKVSGAFLEALRMYPSAAVMIREATEDTMLYIPNLPGENGPKPVVMPKGSQVTIDQVGLQYNPLYFPDPRRYQPSRWYNENRDKNLQESDAVTAFSVGPRACIGRKFAIVEATAFLTVMIRQWKIEPKLNPGETVQEWKTRILDAGIQFTLGIRDVPVVFTRRSLPR